MMRRTNTRLSSVFILAVVTACLPISARSQISLSAEFKNVTYLQFEGMPISVTVRNDTGDALVLGGPEQGAPALGFEVKKDGRVLPRVTKGRIVRNVVVLMPGKSKEVVVDVANHFVMQAAGQYHVTAEVRMKNAKYVCKSVVVEIVSGIEVKVVERPVFDYEECRRTYSLLSWRRDGKEQLFLSIRDKEQKESHGVYSLGPMLSLTEPVLKIGTSGLVVVKHQSGAVSIARSTFRSDKNGVRLVKQTTEVLQKPKSHVEPIKSP